MNHNFLELYRYRELSAGEQLRINLYLINTVRQDYYFNIVMRNDAERYSLTKLKSINFDHDFVYVCFKLPDGKDMELPLDLLSRLEIAEPREI